MDQHPDMQAKRRAAGVAVLLLALSAIEIGVAVGTGSWNGTQQRLIGWVGYAPPAGDGLVVGTFNLTAGLDPMPRPIRGTVTLTPASGGLLPVTTHRARCSRRTSTVVKSNAMRRTACVFVSFSCRVPLTPSTTALPIVIDLPLRSSASQWSPQSSPRRAPVVAAR